MCKVCSLAYSTTALAVGMTTGTMPYVQFASAKQQSNAAQLAQLDPLPSVLTTLKPRTLKDPTWLSEQKAADAAASKRVNSSMPANSTGKRVVTYDVTTKGAIISSLAEFKQQANTTLNDQRGWSRMGVTFQEVSTGGQFTLVLSEASQVPSFSPGGCDAEYSCRAGRYVIINQDRWSMATPSWNAAGGSLRDYRHMVVNHETGHWLGHGHASCTGAGQPAQVMQQQSMSLQGCSFSAWPTTSELWSTQLGIGQ